MFSRASGLDRERRSGLRWLRRLILTAIVAALAWGSGLAWYARQIPLPAPNGENADRDVTRTDAIVVQALVGECVRHFFMAMENT